MSMAEVSKFFETEILMPHESEQNIKPRFHAKFRDYEAVITIDDLRVIQGSLPPRTYWLIVHWALLHREDLSKNWALILKHKEPHQIQPLS